MVTLRGTSALLHLLILCVYGDLCCTESSQAPCNATVTYKDLGSVLRWECLPTLNPNTTFTVRFHTQGRPLWKKVSACVNVTSHSCDLSQVFKDLDLFNSIQLEVAEAAGRLRLLEMQVDLLSHMEFSAPSVKVSLNGSLLLVQVQFPASRSCSLCPQRRCPCSVSMVMNPMTTITVHDAQQPSESQTCTLEAKEDSVVCEFTVPELGRQYCVVANFTSSASSNPYCILRSSSSDALLFVWLGACALLCLPAALLCTLRQRWASAASPIPRTLESLQDDVCRELGIPHEDCTDDHLSILSLSVSRSTLSLPEDPGGLGDGYYSNPFLLDSEADSDDARSLAALGCEARHGFNVSFLESNKGTLLLPIGCGGATVGRMSLSDVPLDSVKLGLSEAGAFEDWGGFSGLAGSQECQRGTVIITQHLKHGD